MKKQEQKKKQKMDERSNKRSKVARRFSHGTVRTKFVNGNKETIIVDIENFVNIPRTRDIYITNIQACGYKWKVRVFLREGTPRNDDGPRIRIFLTCDGEITDAEANSLIANARFRSKTAIERFFGKGIYRNYSVTNYCVTLQRRQVIENELNDDGTFTFEVDIEITKRAVWYPNLNTLNNDIGTKLYRSFEELSDVTFLVGQSKEEIMVHKIVLAAKARELYELVITEEQSTSSSENDTAIILPDIDASAFEALLRFCYIGTVPEFNKEFGDDEIEAKAKNILLVADRFGCKDLKLYIESYIVENILLPSKAARLLLLADSYSCALLKEASMNLCLAESKTVMTSSHNDWNKLKESNDLLAELLLQSSSGRSNVKYSSVVINGDGTVNDADGLDVTSLRERLQKYHLDVDGSKEMLLQRWKDHSDSGVFS